MQTTARESVCVMKEFKREQPHAIVLLNFHACDTVHVSIRSSYTMVIPRVRGEAKSTSVNNFIK